MRRLALDLGKHLGWCSNRKPEWESGHIELLVKGKSEESIYAFFRDWLDANLLDCLNIIPDKNRLHWVEQIVYEMPFVRNRCNDGVILYGLLGVLKLFAYDHDIQLVPIHPLTLKCQITGSGRADKSYMMEIASHAMDKPITSSDEADAVCLMLYAEFGTTEPVG